MLALHLVPHRAEAGCDEAGRGCLAGPVVAACVLLPDGFADERLNDSKQLSAARRETLRSVVEAEADAWAVAAVGAEGIDRRNILHASTHAMCLAAADLLQPCDTTADAFDPSADGVIAHGGRRLGQRKPQFLLVDGNRFYNETPLPHECIVHGDATFLAIAAASILAKTHRDAIMAHLDSQYPGYRWAQNKAYPTADHYDAILALGPTPQHRRSFALYRQPTLF